MKSRIYAFFAGYALLVFACFAFAGVKPWVAVALYVGYVVLCYWLMSVEPTATHNEGEEA